MIHLFWHCSENGVFQDFEPPDFDEADGEGDSGTRPAESAEGATVITSQPTGESTGSRPSSPPSPRGPNGEAPTRNFLALRILFAYRIAGSDRYATPTGVWFNGKQYMITGIIRFNMTFLFSMLL
ncbi:hypothetical protein ANCCAN_05130 [Ancylostoma caninum]|uniref:Uncharacterized protein n=1 Tax=Ancylostoma caninum TaxID=29170 RepID=A0A368GWW3_ANCCA|nr:hypothetical protein ANCCAN_05130 [Ancylostoma caninum]